MQTNEVIEVPAPLLRSTFPPANSVENEGVGLSGHPSSGHSSSLVGSQMSHKVARKLS